VADQLGYRRLGQPAGNFPAGSLSRGQGPNAFKDPAGVLATFRSAYPGESGTRNPLRGDGYFGIDTGLSKYFRITERVKAQLRWETFNVTTPCALTCTPSATVWISPRRSASTRRRSQSARDAVRAASRVLTERAGNHAGPSSLSGRYG